MRFDPMDVERKCEEIAEDLESSLRDYMTDIPEALVEILVNEIWEFNHTEQAIRELESEHIQALEDQAQERKFEKEGM
jgi:1,6-anhydro-N-acetylmuramate kinase